MENIELPFFQVHPEVRPRSEVLPGSQQKQNDILLRCNNIFGSKPTLRPRLSGSALLKDASQVKRVDYKVDNMEGYAQWSLTRSCEKVSLTLGWDCCTLVQCTLLYINTPKIAITFCSFHECNISHINIVVHFPRL